MAHEPEDADRAFLWDMLEAARGTSALIAGMTFDQFRSDRRTYRAVERELEILGEAARNVSSETRSAHPEIPWISLIGQRNVLVHQYGRVRYDLLWEAVTRNLPALIGQLETLLPPSPPDPEPEP